MKMVELKIYPFTLKDMSQFTYENRGTSQSVLFMFSLAIQKCHGASFNANV